MLSKFPRVSEFPLNLFLLTGALVVTAACALVGEWILIPLAFFSGATLGGVVYLLALMVWSGFKWLIQREK